ncbi:MAG: hypothetical protein JXR77_00795 [Lentisphaeria bacterium]|nr:hypothetical protein [Lentisphaeria bacterium]
MQRREFMGTSIAAASGAAVWAALPVTVLPGRPEGADPGFPNHHLHNFACGEASLPIHEHALAMGYRYVVSGKPKGERYAQLDLIGNTNASVCPIRVYREKGSGLTRIAYLGHFADRNGRNAIAALHGLDRPCHRRTAMTEEDLRLLKGYAAAKRPLDDLTLANANYEEIFARFHPKWVIDEPDRVGFNLSMNWINRTVVATCIKALTESFPWDRYQAIFFDSLGDGASPIRTTNPDALPGGPFPTRAEGHFEFVRAVCNFARDPARTGQPRPYRLFANIYDPLSANSRKHILRWYGQDLLRFDHYYLEKGGEAATGANGNVPGSTEPAYVDFGENALPDAYLPARLVAFDDHYGWSRKREFLRDFDHGAFLEQHLQAAGHAAIQGSWFGWYGEDTVSRRDSDGRLIYSNACQLLRALPNWDNMAGVPVPGFGDYHATDQRRWDGRTYGSPNSFASPEVVYSRNPDNGELYVVYLSETGIVRLPVGTRIEAGAVANEWFVATDRNALPALAIAAGGSEARLADLSLLGKGLRLKLTRAAAQD